MSEPRRSTRRLIRRTGLLAAASAALFALSSPAAGDWLVMADGTRVETRGPWEVKGKLVVFTRPAGGLASLRLAEVDLEASREATSAAAAAAAGGESRAQEAPPPKAPVLVITDADVGGVDPATLAARRAELALRSRIVIYTTDWCPVCKKAKAYLAELGVPYVERDIEKSPLAREEFDRRFGRGAGVPVLDVGGTVLRGFKSRETRQAVERLKEKVERERQAAARP